MSLFQPKLPQCQGDHAPDSVPLRQLGCEAVFTRYEADQTVGPVINISRARNLLVTGTAVLTCQGKSQTMRAGDWIELPARKEYTLRYLSDSLVIEFWFDNSSR